MASSALICETEAWNDLKAHVEEIKKTHLRDPDRCRSTMIEIDGMLLVYSHQRATLKTFEKLFKLAEKPHLKEKINSMFICYRVSPCLFGYLFLFIGVNSFAMNCLSLCAPRDAAIQCDGKNVVPEVWKVLDKIHDFSEKVCSGSWVGATGKSLTDVVSIGIAGSYFDPRCAYCFPDRNFCIFVLAEFLLMNVLGGKLADPEAAECVPRDAKHDCCSGLANVDLIDVARNITGLNPETTLGKLCVVSETFTTDELMLNARTMKERISASLGPEAVAKHMVAVSTNLPLVEKFGIDPNNAFAFWDWVGRWYSVCSAVGVLPLSLQYGFSVGEKFLKGASRIDHHFYTAPFEKNIPVLLGLLSLWNLSFNGYPARVISFWVLHNVQLLIFAGHRALLLGSWEVCSTHPTGMFAHLVVSMESNGKGVSIDGVPLPFEAGGIDFGGPGTNSQHSFYQLIHQVINMSCITKY
ncbi:Phosphoglucose isomerase (PGI) [Dillenia turbinata]|uniref:Glucose-6-phosphate isomerase n=1 Tax=Dillenia turbinata TaxID=194707 RepID=A0AAN8ZIA7_9MAGN